MFNHVMVGSNDIDQAQRFYDAVFSALGAAPGRRDDEKGRLYYRHKGGLYMVTRPINAEAACFANGGTIGFSAEGPEQVDAWHQAGVESGGESCEGPPGVREGPPERRYLAYLRDPDGNKLCAIHWLRA